MDENWYLFAHDYRMAPPLLLNSTHEKMLDTLPLETLKKYAIDLPKK